MSFFIAKLAKIRPKVGALALEPCIEAWERLKEKIFLWNVQVYELNPIICKFRELNWNFLLLYEILDGVSKEAFLQQEALFMTKPQNVDVFFVTDLYPTPNSCHPTPALGINSEMDERKFFIEYIFVHNPILYKENMVEICGPAIQELVARKFSRRILALEMAPMQHQSSFPFWNQLHIGNYAIDTSVEDIIAHFSSCLRKVTFGRAGYAEIFCKLDEVRENPRMDWATNVYRLR